MTAIGETLAAIRATGLDAMWTPEGRFRIGPRWVDVVASLPPGTAPDEVARWREANTVYVIGGDPAAALEAARVLLARLEPSV